MRGMEGLSISASKGEIMPLVAKYETKISTSLQGIILLFKHPSLYLH